MSECRGWVRVEAEIEIRRIFEAEDFGAQFTPELREQAQELANKTSS